ncbi:MAG: leucine-rich repeat protein, partial [Alistipes sp.]|nr:leucine-rich repeat protein [Alistipes sp.]
IGDFAFDDCKSLAGSLVLPESLESIGGNAFYSCRMLSGNLVLPSKLTTIPYGCFFGCGFTGDLVIPESVTEIGDSAFSGCKFDGHLTISKSIKKIEGNTFGTCKFQGELVIPKSVQIVGGSAFYGNSFSSIIFEQGSELVKIEERAFGWNKRLSEPIVLPEGLMTIGSSAFYGCDNIPAVTIPSTVTTIGGSAFNNCYYITSFRCDAAMPPVVGSGAFDGVGKDNLTLQVPEQSVPLYQTANGWADFKRISPYYDFSISRKHIRALNAEFTNNYMLRVPSGEPWKVESCPEWVSVTPSSGIGRTEVTITVSQMARTTDTFTFEEMDEWGNWITETHKGRAGDIVFLLTNKEQRVNMAVQQYDCDNYDGEVILNQPSTAVDRKKGVNLVFMGDCFDARDIANGSYLNGINEAIGYFFAIEPYKTYRDHFNVYTVVGMSVDSGMGSVNTIKDAKFGSQYSLDGIAPNTDITFEYAMKAETVKRNNLHQSLVVMVENTTDYGGVTYMWGDGSAIAVCPMSRDAYPFDYRGIVQHEAGGHGFAKLGDEYIYHNAFIQTCDCPCCSHLKEFYEGTGFGWYRNLSVNGDHKTVEWAHLFAHPDYTDKVDMYEGGYFHSRGIYRSEANSCMNNNVPYYSAISRQEMVERIMRYSGQRFSITKFYANDVRDASNNDFVTKSVFSASEPTITSMASAAKQMPP